MALRPRFLRPTANLPQDQSVPGDSRPGLVNRWQLITCPLSLSVSDSPTTLGYHARHSDNNSGHPNLDAPSKSCPSFRKLEPYPRFDKVTIVSNLKTTRPLVQQNVPERFHFSDPAAIWACMISRSWEERSYTASGGKQNEEKKKKMTDRKKIITEMIFFFKLMR